MDQELKLLRALRVAFKKTEYLSLPLTKRGERMSEIMSKYMLDGEVEEVKGFDNRNVIMSMYIGYEDMLYSIRDPVFDRYRS